MLDGYARKIIDGPLNMVGKQIAKTGVTANQVTLAGLVLGLIAALLIALGNVQAGLWILLISRVADGLDGAVARATHKTDFGGFWDIVADFFFYGAIPVAFVILDPTNNAIAGAVLLMSFYFNGGTFLGYAILAEKHKLSTEQRGSKSLYFSTGLLEGTETIAFFVACCVWPQHFAIMAYLFAAACFYTAASRIWLAYQEFSTR
ncbi:CDP-alcohol phosphatidyltransferase family protein [Maritalea porphyrae]|uniref:Membrane protein n=1 Tax=Maritalea porphyrae TaxID=880732 RepID=A0ABQ5UT49_9HYPH|nr:CDP-alcohol phosphatidyltransferase family protein [Maritalea porphyrae]GLQ17556.1 membrane protein [Maritalea porphyrae]